MKSYNCELIGRVVSVEENPEGCEFYLNVKRSQDKEDLIPVTVSNEILGDRTLEPEKDVRILGIIRTYKMKGTYKSRLRVEATTLDILDEEVRHKNTVFGRFGVKMSKSIRHTKTGCMVKDVVLRQEIPIENGVSEFRAILWNKDAEMFDNITDCTQLYIIGRLQSREYLKKTDDGNSIKVRTYEVSVGKVEDDTDKYAEEVSS